MKPPPLSIVLFALAVALGAVGPLLCKSGADRARGSLGRYLANPRLLGGLARLIGGRYLMGR